MLQVPKSLALAKLNPTRGSEVIPSREAKRIFPKVQAAREILRERAMEILEAYLATIAEARAAGDFEVATKCLQFLMEHMPEEEGVRLLDISVDRPREVESKGGPAINIGIALGGMNQPKELPAVIDVQPIPPKNDHE
jgi:hypothetical protein